MLSGIPQTLTNQMQLRQLVKDVLSLTVKNLLDLGFELTDARKDSIENTKHIEKFVKFGIGMPQGDLRVVGVH